MSYHYTQQVLKRARARLDLTEQGPQAVVPGAERISNRELAERKMRGKLQPSKPQKPADDGLFDVAGRGQEEMF